MVMDPVLSAIHQLDPGLFVVSIMLFFLGLLSSYPVKWFDVGVLQWYPLWIWRHVREWLSPGDPWIKLFLFLFGFNATSLFVNFVAGYVVVLPFVLIFLLGLNLGVISIEEAGGYGVVALIVLNPVAWLELPAAWTAATLGIQLGRTVLVGGLGDGFVVFPELLNVYLVVVLPLLFMAALLESSLIWLLGSEEGVRA